ncbi:polynucleotide kinase 3 phosphatase-domain-containing protein [Stachybotrys elegans]|uniref:Polynucleotide kinase 3 phosphatase-domain-containing protein n=1 Tax=Stachybotrys elegans TaxID=80388 RepID=A0A8K0WJU7_9HYPO|nr:polynucleotide kinase 3 phosphatase-domain-containing protein [Stachybotrys elegans]
MTIWTLQGASLLIGVYSPFNKPQSLKDAHSSVKIAAFDLDGTVIKTKSGKVRSQDSQDWQWWDTVVPLKIRQAYDQGFVIKIITNQGRLTDLNGNEAPEAKSFKRTIQQILDSLNVPLSIYVACANDSWRKPRIGIWELLAHEYEQQEIEIDQSNSFFVGDGAGRASDHTDADFHYSLNLDIGFHTPEDYFLQVSGETPQHKFDPSLFLKDKSSWIDVGLQVQDHPRLAIVLVGGPGAGKTYFFNKILRPLGYHCVSLHSLGSQERCAERFENALKEGSLVVIDQINFSIQSRRIWLSTASKYKIKVTAVFFDLPAELCLHNDTVRALGGGMMNPEGRAIFPRNPFLKLMDEFQRPTMREGFTEVISMGFQWMGSDEELQIWRKYWI